MANEFKVKKGLLVDGTGTVVDVQGTQGQLFSVTDSLTGDLFSVSDTSGIPILNINSSGLATIDGNLIVDNIKMPTVGGQIRIGSFTSGTSSDGEYANDDILVGDGSISIYPHRRGDYGLNESTATSTTFRSKLNIWSDNEDHITFGGANTHMVTAWEEFKIWINNDSASAGTLHLYNKTTKTEFAKFSGDGASSFISGKFFVNGELESTSLDVNGNADISGTLTLGGHLQEPVLRTEVSVANTYVRIFTVTDASGELATMTRLSGTSHGTGHVGNFTALIMTNHSGDVVVKSFSSFYTDVTIKVDTNTNADATISIKSDTSNAATYKLKIETLSPGATYALLPSSGINPAVSHEHVAGDGSNETGVGGTLTHDFGGKINAANLDISGSASFGGNVSASSGTGHFSIVNASAYQLNGTYIVDSSRNLVNISSLTIDSNGSTDNYYITCNESGTNRLTIYENSDDIYINASGDIALRPRQLGGTGNMMLYGGSSFIVHKSQTPYSETTQGKGIGAIHLDPNNSTAHAGASITWGASDSGGGEDAQAGIYVRSDGTYGTKMYLATTDAYSSGSKTAISIDESGNTAITRGRLEVSTGNLFLGNVDTGTGNTALILNTSTNEVEKRDIGSLAFASSVSVLTGSGSISTHPGTGNLIHTGPLGASVTGLFPSSDNSNSIITVNRHSGNYNSQLGFSSNGAVYYRKFSNSTAYTSQGWNEFAFVNQTISIGSIGDLNSASWNANTSLGGLTLKTQSGVTAGSYTNANITVNSKGIISAVSNGSSGSNVVLSSSSNGAIGNLTAGSSGQQMEKGTTAVTTLRYDGDRWRLYAGAGSGEVLTVEQTGKIGIKDSTPDYPLDVNHNVSGISIYASHDIAAYSDKRVKKDIETIPNALDKVSKLRGVTFKRTDKGSSDKTHMGVIAQEIQEIIPEVVTERPSDGHLSVSYGNVVGVLIEAIKELKAEVEELKGVDKCKCKD